MSGSRRYVLDANVFIEAQNRYYAVDICPGFWVALTRQHKAGRIFSIDRVRKELLNLDLRKWIEEKLPRTFFKGTGDKKVADAFAEMVMWVQDQQFKPQAKAEFSSVADGWLVAYAKVNGQMVVTHEEYAPAAEKKVHIPNVCVEFNVPYCDTFEMLRSLKEQFVQKTRRRKQ
ncbi:MAG: DUF4411 family protein [Phycisphaerae bacterium]|jgi:hypothetical protein